MRYALVKRKTNSYLHKAVSTITATATELAAAWQNRGAHVCTRSLVTRMRTI